MHTHTHTLKLEPTRTRTHSKACAHTHTHALLAHWLNSPLSAHVASCWLPATFGSSVGWNFFGKSVPKLFGYKIFFSFSTKVNLFRLLKKDPLVNFEVKRMTMTMFLKRLSVWLQPVSETWNFDHFTWNCEILISCEKRNSAEQESSALSLIIALLCKLQYYGHFSKHCNVSSRYSK